MYAWWGTEGREGEEEGEEEEGEGGALGGWKVERSHTTRVLVSLA